MTEEVKTATPIDKKEKMSAEKIISLERKENNFKRFKCTVTMLESHSHNPDRTITANVNGTPYKFQEGEEVILPEDAINMFKECGHEDFKLTTDSEGRRKMVPYFKKFYAIEKGDEVK